MRTIIPALSLLTFALFLSVYVVPPSLEAQEEFAGQNVQLIIAIGRSIAFIVGATFSILVGQMGMRMAIQASVRAASAARTKFE